MFGVSHIFLLKLLNGSVSNLQYTVHLHLMLSAI